MKFLKELLKEAIKKCNKFDEFDFKENIIIMKLY
jgi:hypothetical protein